MVILQISAYAGPTCGNHIASLLCMEQKMKDLGHETVYVLLESVRDYSWCKELQSHATVYFLPVRHARILPKTYLRLRQIFKNHNISIIHSHFELYDIPIACTAPKSSKIFWHLHDPIEDSYQTAPRSRRLLTKLHYSRFAKKAQLITVSEKHGDFACKLGFDKTRLHYVPNGLDISRIQNCSISEKDTDFLMFCWDYYRKGTDLAITAGDVLLEGGYDFTIRMVPLHERVECKRPYIIGQAAVDDVNQLFLRSKCFLHLSRAEGLSYALLEAIYSGIPVISSDIPENRPVKSCPTVIMVQSENIDQIQSAMKSILDNSFVVNAEMVCKSRQVIKDCFSIDKWANDIIRIYFEERL